jgi:spermidine synthase
VRAFAEVAALTAARKPDFRALMIGGGGYALPRYLEAVYPESQLDVVELDPAVTAIARQRLGLRRETRIRTQNGDARAILREWPERPAFDLVYGDAFNDLSMPYHLTTVEFLRLVRDLLNDDGVYLANVIDNLASNGRVVSAFVRTFRAVFGQVYLLRWGPYEPSAIETLVVVGAKRPLDLRAIREHAPMREQPGRTFASEVIEGEALDRIVEQAPAPVLTDERAPVDQLAAPLFVLRD